MTLPGNGAPITTTKTTEETKTTAGGLISILKSFTPKQWIYIVVMLIAYQQGGKILNIPQMFGIQTTETNVKLDSNVVTLQLYERNRQSDQFLKTLDSININNKLDQLLQRGGWKSPGNKDGNGEYKK